MRILGDFLPRPRCNFDDFSLIKLLVILWILGHYRSRLQQQRGGGQVSATCLRPFLYVHTCSSQIESSLPARSPSLFPERHLRAEGLGEERLHISRFNKGE